MPVIKTHIVPENVEEIRLYDYAQQIFPTIPSRKGVKKAIAREEIFGPVLATISFKEIDQAIEIAHDSPYGLAAGIWTSDINIAHKAARDIQAGSVSINSYNSIDIALPFGGYKQSGIGVENSLEGLAEYTNSQTIVTRDEMVPLE